MPASDPENNVWFGLLWREEQKEVGEWTPTVGVTGACICLPVEQTSLKRFSLKQ